VTLATPRAGTFARAGNMEARTATRFATPGNTALHGKMMRPEMRVAVRFGKFGSGSADEKARGRFRRGLLKILATMKICR
jgi:hypothetical protein